MSSRLPSLRTRLALLFGAFALALAVVLSFAFEQSAAWRLRVAQEAQLVQAASQMADRLDRDMYERLRDVILLASTDGVTSVAQPDGDGRTRLEHLQKSFPNYAWIGVTDETGKILVATGGILEGADASRRPWFGASRAGPAALDAHPALMLEPYLPKAGPEPLRLVDVAAPIVGADGHVRGTVAAHLSLSWAREVQQAIFRSISDLKDAEVLVISRTGEILVGPPAMVGRILPERDIHVDAYSRTTPGSHRGPAYLGAVAETRGYRNFAGFGWKVIARQPAVAALAPVRDLRIAMLIAGAGVSILFVLGGAVIARSVAQPLEALAEAADNLRTDPSASIGEIPSRFREVQTLTHSLASAVEELQRRKEALRTLNGTLEVKVAERTQQLQAAKDVAEAATRAKTDFLATMSHELRSPLSSIIGFCDLLLETASLEGTARRRLELIQSAGSALTCVINDILDFSKIEAGRVEIVERPFRFDCLVDGCVSIMGAQADAKGVALTTEVVGDLPPWVSGDEGRLRQVLLNLVNNAVKFTKAGRITLKIERDAHEGNKVRFSVVDTGIGIPADRIHRLFQRFSQADSSVEREFGGTGLGLAISQRLVELMGGQITVTSRVGGGSTFSFAISLPKAQAQSEPAPLAALQSPSRPLRILLAEDLVPNQEIATAILARAGHSVEIVGDGQEAVEAALSGSYDLILMDVQMPRMDGLAATQAIRALPGPIATIPIIAMTANVLAEQVQRFRRGGMDGHVGKPIDARELLAQIATVAARLPEALPAAPVAPAAPAAPAATPKVPMPEPDSGFEPARYNEILELLGPEKVCAYIRDLRGRASGLPTVVTPETMRELGAAAHKMVALAGMLGFTDLADNCRLLDAACDENSETVQEVLTRVNAVASRALPTIAALEEGAEQRAFGAAA